MSAISVEEHPKQTIEVFGRTMAYVEMGKGEPIVFLHGIYVSRAQWSRQVDALSRKYKVITCDLRGHGESSRNSKGYDIAELANDVAHLLDHLGVEIALAVDLLPHPEDLLRARVNAELAPLAAVGADDDLRHRCSFLS